MVFFEELESFAVLHFVAVRYMIYLSPLSLSNMNSTRHLRVTIGKISLNIPSHFFS